MSDFTEALKQEISETEQILAGLKALLRSKEGRDTKPAGTQSELPNIPTLAETGTINLDELELPKKRHRKKSTLMDDIKNVIERFSGQEFTVAHVEAALKGLGKGSDAKHFRNRVSVAIRKLTDEKVLERTFKGSGSDPHKYRIVKKLSFVSKG